MDISINKNAFLRYLLRRVYLPEIQAGVNGFGILSCHSPEWILDDDRCVVANTELQKQNMLSFVLSYKAVFPVVLIIADNAKSRKYALFCASVTSK